jgi:hypothetical protein
MSLLDELKIRYQTSDDGVWINLPDLSNHLLYSVQSFVNGVVHESSTRSVSPPEQFFMRGIAEGMMSVVTLLAQSGVEIEFHEKINTVEDLIKTLDNGS